MQTVTKELIRAHTGIAFELKQGQLLKVTDPEGEQVSELICYNLKDLDEWLCSGRTLDHARTWAISKGDVLFSNRSNPMFSILEDTCGRHDFFLAPCNQHTIEQHGVTENHQQSCHQNLYHSLMGWDIDPDEIYTTFSIFMHVKFRHDGSISIEKPGSKAGDYVVFRAEMDMIVGLTACASVQYNNGSLKPIEFEIMDA
ncbi:DUF1989 domain-containing protein [Cesiribacter sp. SM1]|uniref:DUF1989 domain-containing protein n=1 Tax=Cesiribacter sp. SM1 TaxID=2861196 RepID=UPI001CD319F8|nr:urea carboxylase-associated family protein [Cesiribacter sp. SM1]